MIRPRILLVEDDANLGLLLRESLEMAEFDVELCADGEAGLAAFRSRPFDLALVDVVLPKRDGFALARDIRAADPNMPIVFLTARALTGDRIEGLRIGADDYVTKPFNLEELILRLRAVLKRTRPRPADREVPEPLTIGRYAFDARLQTLSLDGQVRRLTHKETQLLLLLARNLDAVVARDTALELIWGKATIFNARSMDVFISRLRKYLRGDSALEIQNAHGIGYKLTLWPRGRNEPPGG